MSSRLEDMLALALSKAVAGSGSPEERIVRLLGLEPQEDAAAIRSLLEPNWEADVAGSFNRAARKHYGV